MATNVRQKENLLKQLRSCGVSPWYDNIDRRIIDDGSLEKLVSQGVLGLTTNPAIFEKAITGSCAYDSQIKEAAKNGLSPELIYDELSISDVLRASDILMGVYNSSSGVDGYVSIETWPQFSRDLGKTLEYARKVFKRLSRPNIMIKIPATPEAYEAIKTLISEGINVNATLIFSLKDYELAANAYLEGIKIRMSKGLDVSKASSVASVFVSRIDTRIDGIIDERLANITGQGEEKFCALKGKAAVANSTVIYETWNRLFTGSGFENCSLKGALPQRVLWASTGTKNPQYRDTKYVDELIFKDTVNTMPQATIEAYLDHGCPVTLAESETISKSRDVLRQLSGIGIDINDVCARLQKEGLEAFQKSFDNLTRAIASKVKSSGS